MSSHTLPRGMSAIVPHAWHTKLIVALVLAIYMLLAACAGGPSQQRTARSTLVIGLDVSGSFQRNHESSIDFAANYIYARLNGLGGLKKPTALFVGSIGGERPQETKSFQPIHTLQVGRASGRDEALTA